MVSEETVVLIALGSNIDAPSNLRSAFDRLAVELDVVAASQVYESEPVDADRTPPFLNAVVRVAPTFGPRSLKFGVLRPIERALGRRRDWDRNAPRTIDLDLVLYGSRVESAPDLTLPDPDLLRHAHVAIPSSDIAAEVSHPLDGRRLEEIAAALPAALRSRPDLALVPSA